MQFGDLEIRDHFRAEAVSGFKFRKAPNNMGECIEDPERSQFFHDAATVSLIRKGKEVPAEESTVSTQPDGTTALADDPVTEVDVAEKPPEGTESNDADHGKHKHKK